MSGETTKYTGRPWWVRLLWAGPGELSSRPGRIVLTVVIAAGAVLLALSGVIHLYLWGKQYGYRSVPTIGPLFLIQGIATILIAVLVVANRRLAAVLVGAGTLVASVVALVLAVEVGLFGFRDSWAAPYAKTSLYEEIAGAVLLLAAAVVIGYSAWPRASSRPASPVSVASR